MGQRQADKLTDDEIFADWVRWIELSYQDALRQGWRHRTFRLLRGVYEQNPNLQAKGGFFIQWAVRNYVDSASMAYRREVDTQGGTENLLHLLREMEKRPQVVSRARFCKTWGVDSAGEADRDFERWRIVRSSSGDRGADYIDPSCFTNDLKTLDEDNTVLVHIQTTIAHRVPERPDAEVPTFAEFHDAIEQIREILGRYYCLLTHRAVAFWEPSPQFNIYEPFRFAWITDPEKFDYSRCEQDKKAGA